MKLIIVSFHIINSTQRVEGAKLFRIRWYGEKPKGNDLVFLELKTHHESWINTKSVKERVNIFEKDVNKFLTHTDFSRSDAELLVQSANPGLEENVMIKSVDLLLTMHELVTKRGLRPCVRSKYQRVAFQSSKNNKLRITVDRDICLIDERGTPRGQWSLDDSIITDKLVIKSPFDVLEVKLAGSEAPTSIDALLRDGVIYDAAKFSKFLTGAASFNKVDMLPYWAEHRAFAPLLTRNVNAKASTSKAIGSSGLFSFDASANLASPRSNDRSNQAPAAMIFKDSIKEQDDGDNTATSHSWMSRRSYRTREASIARKEPCKVEPKTFFANERTLIQWLVSERVLSFPFARRTLCAASASHPLVGILLIL